MILYVNYSERSIHVAYERCDEDARYIVPFIIFDE